MIKVGVADYGLNCWYGALYDYEQRFELLKTTGYDGLERLEARSAAEAVEISAAARRYGLDFVTCRGGTPLETLRWSAGLGKRYVWIESQAKDFSVFCRQANEQIRAAADYGVHVALHNHLGLTVETQEQLDAFMENCPDCQLLLDVGHLAAAGGDPVETIRRYAQRLAAVHLKDYVYKDRSAEHWWDRLRFCELGAGVMGEQNVRIIETLTSVGYDGWLLVEHDTHLHDPAEDLAVSREYIRKLGI